MTRLQAVDVRAIVAETMAEQQRTGRDDVDAIVVKVVATTLTSFGLDEDDRKERIFSTCGAGAEESSRHRAMHSRLSSL
jgi:hypothetical protein